MICIPPSLSDGSQYSSPGAIRRILAGDTLGSIYGVENILSATNDDYGPEYGCLYCCVFYCAFSSLQLGNS